MSTLSFFWITFQKKNVRADYQAQIETQLSNKKFVTIMASAIGGFRFLTKKSVYNMILVYEGFFQNNFRWLFKVIFFSPHFDTIKIMKFSKKTQNTLRTELSRFTRVFLKFWNCLLFRGWNCCICLFFSLFLVPKLSEIAIL